MKTNEIIIETHGLTREYVRDGFHVVALKEVDLSIERGDFLALMGPSGSGKSTLLHLMAGMDTPTSGEIRVLGHDLHELNKREIARWRNRHVGFVFQSFNLIPVLTALENVELPLKLTSLNKAERLKHATAALELVGLGDRINHRPKQLSGGQEQRVAIARALATDPDLLLADEPTGNLDATAADEVLSIFARLHWEFGKTIVMVTHDPHAASFAFQTIQLEKGNLIPQFSDPPGEQASDSGTAPAHPGLSTRKEDEN